MTKRYWLVSLLPLGLCLLRGDTVTTTEKVSVNAKVIKLTDNELTVVARFESGDKTFQIAQSDTEIIEFNNTTFNAGAPPKAFGLGPPLKNEKIPRSTPESPDTIVLRGGQHRECKLTGIDDQFVHCFGKDGDYPRKIVLRILVGQGKAR